MLSKSSLNLRMIFIMQCEFNCLVGPSNLFFGARLLRSLTRMNLDLLLDRSFVLRVTSLGNCIPSFLFFLEFLGSIFRMMAFLDLFRRIFNYNLIILVSFWWWALIYYFLLLSLGDYFFFSTTNCPAITHIEFFIIYNSY